MFCYNCLTKITPQDEQQVLNSKTPVSQSESGNPGGSSPPELSLTGGGGGGRVGGGKE